MKRGNIYIYGSESHTTLSTLASALRSGGRRRVSYRGSGSARFICRRAMRPSADPETLSESRR